MTRLKGFGADIDQHLLTSGAMHQPDLSNLQRAEVVTGDESADAYLHALKVGIPVVTEALEPRLSLISGFEYFPDKQIEEHRSAHGVSFGRFFGWIPRKRTEGTIMSTAVKPFDSPEAALREFNGYRRLGALMVETFQPIGIFPAKTGDHFVAMTRKREDLISLDGGEWLVGQRVDSAEAAEVVGRNQRTVQDVAQAIAYIQANEEYHPDGQVKNWAVTPSGRIGVIDTENLTHCARGSADVGALAWDDIEKFVRSLVLDSRDGDSKMFGVGMFAGQSIQQVRNSVERLIINPYVETLMVMADQHRGDAEFVAHTNQLFKAVTDRFYEDEGWPLNVVNQTSGSPQYAVASRA